RVIPGQIKYNREINHVRKFAYLLTCFTKSEEKEIIKSCKCKSVILIKKKGSLIWTASISSGHEFTLKY
ncbi:hypothetical protein BpHYR1_049530, partial [Brachionus plicatilis]